ncbi:MAG TPA: MmcQ/YjbR family DNA-binding protein [Flavobacteriales bacterium]|nr:MmcQ/YjbR family DNA-binding protein [Flavobacteriales bacterium]MBP6642435.1 MmcQ/YjbR family DNA-binding protein [Flavobacteriales bacterium]MBP7155567.1 MmcQ/YjbR family DNA-binding protein [Flavobacteriales bacterium]HQV53756.1 MmcQ/YjbR family DNA-binding protein [Flavobacteriales bacterium]
MDAGTAREMALDMPGTLEKVRYGRPNFSVKKKGYMNLWLDEGRAVIKLSVGQQETWNDEDPDHFTPLPGRLGKLGWTNVFLGTIEERRFRFVVDLAWRNVAPKWLILTRQAPPKG